MVNLASITPCWNPIFAAETGNKREDKERNKLEGGNNWRINNRLKTVTGRVNGKSSGQGVARVLVGDSLNSWLSDLGQMAPLFRSLSPLLRESIWLDKMIWLLQSTIHMESYKVSLTLGLWSLGVTEAKSDTNKRAFRVMCKIKVPP